MWAPRQRWIPLANVRCRLEGRSGTNVAASGNSRSSRLAGARSRRSYFLDRDAADLGVLRRLAGVDHRAPQAEEFLHRPGGEQRVGRDPVSQLGIRGQVPEDRPDELLGRVEAGQEQEEAEPHELVLLEPLAVDLDPEQQRHEVVAGGVGRADLEEGVEVLVDRLDRLDGGVQVIRDLVDDGLDPHLELVGVLRRGAEHDGGQRRREAQRHRLVDVDLTLLDELVDQVVDRHPQRLGVALGPLDRERRRQQRPVAGMVGRVELDRHHLGRRGERRERRRVGGEDLRPVQDVMGLGVAGDHPHAAVGVAPADRTLRLQVMPHLLHVVEAGVRVVVVVVAVGVRHGRLLGDHGKNRASALRATNFSNRSWSRNGNSTASRMHRSRVSSG